MNDWPVEPSLIGINRGDSPLLPPDVDDYGAIGRWLATKRVGTGKISDTTLDQYSGEAHRLLFYLRESKGLTHWTQDDAVRYLAFLEHPPANAIRPPGHIKRTDPRWRPFVSRKAPSDGAESASQTAGLRGSTLRQSQTIITGLFIWLHQAGYLRVNPFLGIRPAKRISQTNVVARGRFLSDRELAYARAAIAARVVSSETDQWRQARDAFLLDLFALTGLRTSEALAARMGDIRLVPVDAALLDRSDSAPAAVWLLSVREGKGGSTREVPCNDLIPSLSLYRQAYGLQSLPATDEARPLLLSARRSTPGYSTARPIKTSALRWEREKQNRFPGLRSRRSVREIVRSIFVEAADFAKLQGATDAELLKLLQASTHWLRHSYGKSIARRTSILTAARNLGHADTRTTQQNYLDDEVILRALETLGVTPDSE